MRQLFGMQRQMSRKQNLRTMDDDLAQVAL
jgi:hypothetical protein